MARLISEITVDIKNLDNFKKAVDVIMNDIRINGKASDFHIAILQALSGDDYITRSLAESYDK